MNLLTHLQLVAATASSGNTVMTKSASASSEQAEVIAAAWPQAEDGISKVASLARIIATGILIEEAENSLQG